MENQENTQEMIKKVMSGFGKKSAASPLRTKEYYSKLGKKSAASKKKQKKQSLSSFASDILTGRI